MDETGLAYYGARYYQNRYSLWLSVDPLSFLYPLSSPYTFTGNNPVILVDPDGRSIDPATEEAGAMVISGADAILGQHNPFYYDGKSGQIKYRTFNRKDFNDSQLALIDSYVSLIDDSEKHHVIAVNHNEKIFLPNDQGVFLETTLEKEKYNGATYGNVTYLARDPKVFEDVPDMSHPNIDRRNPDAGPFKVLATDCENPNVVIGISGIHELHHQYQNSFNKELTRSQRNDKVTSFETMLRAIYQIGTYSSWQAFWRINVRTGDPRFLGGKGLKHDP